MNLVYLTTNLITNKKYVGSHSTDNIDDGYLGSGKIFLRSLKKYGKENFKREILEECDDILIARKLEEGYIKEYNTLSPYGYNLSPTGGCSHQGGRLSIEHKKKIGNSLRGKKRDPKIGKKIKETRIKNDTYKLKEETKEKIRKANLGDKNPNWQIPRTEKTKKKISEGNKNKTRSDEQRKNMSIGQTGKKFSDEHKKKISLNNGKYWKNKKLSDDHRKKLSDAHKGKKPKRVKCEYCDKEVGVNMYARFHGKNCKIKR